MGHMKRNKVPKNWPIERKGTTFVVKPSGNGIPLLVVLRNMLSVAQTRKEVKKAIHKKYLLVNSKAPRDEKMALSLFDTVSLLPTKKHYRLGLSEKGKFELNEISEKEANAKVEKVVDKKILRGKKVQLNFGTGRNLITDLKCNTGDSVVLDLNGKKADKCLPMKEKSNVLVFAGKHAGEKGVIEKLMPERKMASIKQGKESVNILIKQLMAVE